MNLLNASPRILLGAALMTVAASGGASTRSTDIAVKDRGNANASLATSGQFVGMAWAASGKEGVTDIYVTMSRDAGETFSVPARVNQVAGEASVSGEQPPRIALIPRAANDPSIVVVWTAKDAAGTRLLSARSVDGGISFASPTPVPGTEVPGNRGWESIATDRDGGVVALWLDHRELAASGAASMNHSGHQHTASSKQQTDGVARAQLSKLFFGRLAPGTGSSRALTGGVCYCCKTAIATGIDGAVYAAWRHVYPGNVRDIAFTMSSDGGQTFAPPVRVSEDHWVLDGCPENGPALTVDVNHRVHVVWATLVPGETPAREPTSALFYAVSEDGRRFSARQRIPTEGFPRHPQIAMGSRGEALVVWDEQSLGTRRIALARGTVSGRGTVQWVRHGIGDGTPAVYPVVATTSHGTIVVWTSGSMGQTVLRVERLAN
jgi:hypothetical protein